MTDFTPRYLADYIAPIYKINTVDLVVTLDDTSTQVKNTMSISKIGNHNKPLVLDGEQLKLLSVAIDGNLLTNEAYVHTEESLTLTLDNPNIILELITEIDPLNNTSLEGLFKSGDAYCTQCEAEGFRRITYYLDRPDVMSVFTTTVIADQTKYPYLLSNGNAIEKGDMDNGQHFVKWHDPFPKPAYLFALVAGDFDLLTDSYKTMSGRNVALEIFVDKGNLNKAHHAMTSLKKSMKWDEDNFGLEYDLDIYMIVAVDFFNMGAMENKGLNVFNSKFVLADEASATDTDYFNIEAVIAHEYFHNWTGNRVTCRDWFQLSLKEGLTVFRDQQFSADMHSQSVTRIQNVRVVRSHQFAEDAGPMAHPIRPEKVMEMNNFYTVTVYEKGAEVIRMLNTLLGKEGFRQGMELYFERFDGMAVTCDDFVDAMADATGKELSQFKRWYSQSGTPELTVKESFDEANQQFNLKISQSNINADEHVEPLHIPVKIELIHPSTKVVQSHLLELTEQECEWSFSFDAKPYVAFLADFSAPVKVNYDQDIDSLSIIMQYANDNFCRWDAGQKLYSSLIDLLVKSPNSDLPSQLIDILESNIKAIDDKAFISLLLTLPSFDEIATSIENVNADSLYNALTILKKFIAINLEPLLSDIYKDCASDNIGIADNIAANRVLKNTCLNYLTMLDGYDNMVNNQFERATNMTDYLGAVSSVVKSNPALADKLLSKFENKWHDTALVMDKWFTLSASVVAANCFERLKQLVSHELFTLENPNRARALIGGFFSQNPKHFHCMSGKGYRFLADFVIKLNEINPQVASRMITPLIQYKEFDLERQKLMRKELAGIQSIDNLSRDLAEKLKAALTD